MKGRLKHSNLDYHAKHLKLLTVKHPLVQLLLERARCNNLYKGAAYVKNDLPQEYWIIGLTNSLRNIRSRCVKCRHRNVNPMHPSMADLPRERLEENVFPYTHNGVDYIGPFEVKFLRCTLKRWCCLFTCLKTRAVAQSLDTDSSLAAVSSFNARRSHPKTIICDIELKAFMNNLDKTKVDSDLAQKKVVWKLNPHRPPHFEDSRRDLFTVA